MAHLSKEDAIKMFDCGPHCDDISLLMCMSLDCINCPADRDESYVNASKYITWPAFMRKYGGWSEAKYKLEMTRMLICK